MFKIDKFTHLKVLLNEVKILQSQLLPEDTGHIHTTISTLESRIEEIGAEIIKRISEHG
jgi:hypothetical protein|tara:strand:+ start:511 stop:687 length:177 start_codon:yes stop_codon:yes gene_type:complete